ncbi:hypothetical protein PMAYCL1PPCAC_14763, partial [Pristionchus mayeri]
AGYSRRGNDRLRDALGLTDASSMTSDSWTRSTNWVLGEFSTTRFTSATPACAMPLRIRKRSSRASQTMKILTMELATAWL